MKKSNLYQFKLKPIFEKLRNYFFKHKLATIVCTLVAILACLTFVVSYAYYKVVDTETIVGSVVGDIPDIDIRIMVEDRDTNGNALGTYSVYPYIPRAGYEYNATDSYCVAGSEIKYNSDDYTVSIDTAGVETCYVYFDSIANLDIILNVFIEDMDATGKGAGTYTMYYDDSMPLIGYKFNSKSSCTNDATISYNLDTGKFVILTDYKTVCNAYMDVVDADIKLNTWVEQTKGAKDYIQVNEIPSNQYYTMVTTGNGKISECSGEGQISFVDQQIVISSKTKTACVAYLDLADGPIMEASSISINDAGAKLFASASPIGNPINKYFYSLDDGDTYKEVQNGNITGNIDDTVLVYGTDSAGNHSNVVEMSKDNNYYYNGIFTATGETKVKNIEQAGYYYIQAWGASENSNRFNLGNYAEGYIYLNPGDTLYIKVGKMSLGNSTVMVNANNDANRVIIAGGEASSYVLTEETKNSYPGTCALESKYYMVDAINYGRFDLFPATVAGEEAGHPGDGYIKISYFGKTIE